MNRSQVLTSYLILSFVFIFLALAFGASQVIAYFSTGAERSDMLILATESVNDYYQPKITWRPLENEGRRMEEGTLVKLSKDYLASYFHLQQAQRTGDVSGLHDYYTEKAREHVVSLVNYHQESSQLSRGTTITHDVQLDFYSEDGTIAALADRVISFHRITSDSYDYQDYDTSEYRVMLLLEDNFWRIRHIVKGEYFEKSDLSFPSIHTDSLFRENNQSFKIRGINYYPQNHPWTDMWLVYDSVDFSTDLKLINSLGFNTIRIFVPYESFGKADVNQEKLSQLSRLMDQAHEQDLKVIVTLFDFFLGYRIEEWTLSDRHAEGLVSTLKDHPALLAWDVKNEPDLDFENIGQTEVLNWLHFMIQRIRSYDAAHPVTIGWSQPEAMKHLHENVDFLSFHYYRNPEELSGILNDIEPKKPIFLGETGSHSFEKWWYPFKKSEKDQLAYYEQIGIVINERNLHYAFWTLYDFQSIPSNVAGRWPWQKGPQKSYGLIDPYGLPKASYNWAMNFNQTTFKN